MIFNFIIIIFYNKINNFNNLKKTYIQKSIQGLKLN